MHFPAMLLTEERHLLYWLGREYVTGAGAIIDGGSFLGGSFYALAAGLDCSKVPLQRRHIECYDTFIANDYMRQAFPGHLQGIETGTSFRGRFEDLTKKYAKYRTVHAGNIEEVGWKGDPIELLVLDVLKSWQTNDKVCGQFFPCVLPGRGVIVHQDYVHEWCPWIPITMEYLREYVECIDIAMTSAIFLVRKQIPLRAVEQCSERMLPHAEQRALFKRAMSRFRGTQRGVLECCEARLLLLQGDTRSAKATLEGIRQRYAGNDHVQWCAAAILRFMQTGIGYTGKASA